MVKSKKTKIDYNKEYKKYKEKYIKYKKKRAKKIPSKIMEGSIGKKELDKLVYSQMEGGKGKTIEVDKEVKKLVPEASKDFLDLYFAVKLGLHHYKIKETDDDQVSLSGREVAEALIDITTKQLEGKLKKSNQLLENIVEGINYGKKSGKDESVENLIKYAKVLNNMYNKQKKKKGSDYSVKKFHKYIVKLMVKLHEAEQEIVQKYQK